MKLTTNSGVTPTRWGSTIRRLVAAGILVAMSLAVPKPARAGRLGADVIALFPKDIGEFAYADLKKARSLKWFPQLREQMLPDRFRQFEKFLASAGVDPNSQVDELAWGLVAEGMSAKTEGAGSLQAIFSGFDRVQYETHDGEAVTRLTKYLGPGNIDQDPSIT
jgi:hypothetical protein